MGYHSGFKVLEKPTVWAASELPFPCCSFCFSLSHAAAKHSLNWHGSMEQKAQYEIRDIDAFKKLGGIQYDGKSMEEILKEGAWMNEINVRDFIRKIIPLMKETKVSLLKPRTEQTA